MNNIQFEHVVTTIANSLMVSKRMLTVNGEEPKHYRSIRCEGVYGMYFQYCFRFDNYGYEKDGETRHGEWERRYSRVVHVVVTETHNVFIAIDDGDFLRKSEKDMISLEWENTSNHDSCWRSDGLNEIRKALWNGYKQCWSHVPEEHRRCLNEADIHGEFHNWFFGNPPFQLVHVTAESVDDYRLKPKAIRIVDFRLNVLDKEAGNVDA